MSINDLDFYLERLDDVQALIDDLDAKEYPAKSPLRQYVNGLLDGARLALIWKGGAFPDYDHPAFQIRACLREAYDQLHKEGKI